MRLRPLSAFLVPVLLAGCTVGPDYQRPEMAVSDQWMEPVSADPVDPRWWDRFNDPVLTALVERAFADSPGLAEASARLAEARAQREAAQGGRLPQGGTSASVTENRLSENGQLPVGSIPGFDPTFPLFDTGFDASWEIDLWGKTSREVESAAAREQAAMWAERDARIVLAAEIARAYVDCRQAQAQLAILRQEADAAANVARLTGLLADAGEANRIDASRAASSSQAAQIALRNIEAEVAGAEYRLAVLAGATPEAIVPELQATSAPVPEAPDIIASGIRSDLLTRRPDIRRAERELAAATAGIGVATADLYPRFSLIGSLGQQAQQTGDLFDSASTRYSVGPSVSWPIFSLGTIRAQVRAADARAQAAAARYEAAIIQALADSEGAANRFAAASASARAAQLALEREQEAYRLVRMREERGEDSRLVLEQARLSLTRAERQALQARAGRSAAAIAFYKALGGGWQ
ncbi:NodT family efflux transporter outer membrane factor (OMF) lipoprotein [Altererythrobacter atlanticus]|uniref:Outer membrane protein OprM n=1 Tax=Croceibacterium atlanticum TaxID=1267766 RepID=A0A0F7KV11_9SPHN|nr:efflux transporter outer membrane subunit [Croceibacterium atlanticum]AKH44193.1 Outer membrane protein OprM precursor [Croceibacterium atlanticum]MBB5732504.1 NodT family efflux transporter outer membrane factor (OMF) lipoprotein [Croceibacterium atlanticum]